MVLHRVQYYPVRRTNIVLSCCPVPSTISILWCYALPSTDAYPVLNVLRPVLMARCGTARSNSDFPHLLPCRVLAVGRANATVEEAVQETTFAGWCWCEILRYGDLDLVLSEVVRYQDLDYACDSSKISRDLSVDLIFNKATEVESPVIVRWVARYRAPHARCPVLTYCMLLPGGKEEGGWNAGTTPPYALSGTRLGADRDDAAARMEVQ
eukprot:2756411-Rhodomonas_salina.1